MKYRNFSGTTILISLLAVSSFMPLNVQDPGARGANVIANLVTAPAPLTWLHTQGRYIKDVNNVTFIPKGACDMALACGPGNDLFAAFSSTTYDIAQTAGANMIRLGINLNTINEPTVVTAVQHAVHYSQDRHLRISLDMHGPDDHCQQGEVWMPTLLNPTAFYAAWSEWATMFQSNTTVAAFGIMNEPPPDGTVYHGHTYTRAEIYALWRKVAETTIQLVHAINPKVLIFLDNVGWSSNFAEFIANPMREPNIVYALHRYYYLDLRNGYSYAVSYNNGDFTNGYTQMQQFYYDNGFKLLDLGYPVIMEEFGAYRPDPQFPTTIPNNRLRQLTDEYALFNHWQAGWLQYQLGGKVNGYSIHHAMLTDNFSGLNEIGRAWSHAMW